MKTLLLAVALPLAAQAPSTVFQTGPSCRAELDSKAKIVKVLCAANQQAPVAVAWFDPHQLETNPANTVMVMWGGVQMQFAKPTVAGPLAWRFQPMKPDGSAAGDPVAGATAIPF
jgi:hypothetical protein